MKNEIDNPATASYHRGLGAGLCLLLAGLLVFFAAPPTLRFYWARRVLPAETSNATTLLRRALHLLPFSPSHDGSPRLARNVSTGDAAAVAKRLDGALDGGSIQIQRADMPRLPAEYRNALKLLHAETYYVVPRSDDALTGYALMKGARGVSDTLLRISLPRHLSTALQNATLLAFALAALAAVVWAAALISLFIKKLRNHTLRVFAPRDVEDSEIRSKPKPSPGMPPAEAPQGMSAEDQVLYTEIVRLQRELESTRASLKESEESYRQMALNASDVLYAMYPEAGRIDWLGQIDQMLGYANGSFPRTIESWADSIHPDEVEGIIALYTEACNTGEEFQVEYRMRHRNGSYRDWFHRGKAIFGAHRRLLKLVGACTDITEKKRAEQRLRESEERLARIFETVAEAIVMVDMQGVVTFANPAAELIYGANRTDIVGSSYTDRRWNIRQTDGAEMPAAEWPLARLRKEKSAVRGVELSFQHESGQIVVVSVNAAPLLDESGATCGAVFSMADITGRKALEDRLAFQAFHDPLTKLPNRALFTDRLAHALVRSRRSHTLIAVFFIDLDNFKNTNDTLGHDAGDALLITTAERVTASIRAGDTAARLAGDEFTIMLDNITDIAQTRIVADRLLKNIIEPVMLKGQEVHAPPSVGIAFGNYEDTPETVMKRADATMYQVKKDGKGHYQIHEYVPEIAGVPVANTSS